LEEQDFIFLFEVGLFLTYISGILSFSASLKVALGSTKYHHQDSGIPNIEITSILLDHGSRTDGGYPYTFSTLSRQFPNESHFFRVGIT
jgi:hypothetical protein